MKLYLSIFSIFLLSFNLNSSEKDCGNLSKKEKVECVAKKIGKSTKEKFTPIDNKFKETHKSISEKTSETEKKIFKGFKNVSNKISENKYIKKIKEKNKKFNEKAKSKN